MRYGLRVQAYVTLLVTDKYPPFSLQPSMAAEPLRRASRPPGPPYWLELASVPVTGRQCLRPEPGVYVLQVISRPALRVLAAHQRVASTRSYQSLASTSDREGCPRPRRYLAGAPSCAAAQPTPSSSSLSTVGAPVSLSQPIIA